MTGQTYLAAELARIAHRDGNLEGLNGSLACSFCIRNRVRAGFYNGSWHQVLSNHRNWSADHESVPYTDEIPDPNNYAFNRLLQEIDGVLAGTTDDSITVPADSITNYMRVGQQRTGDLSVSPTPQVALYYGYLNRELSKFFTENIVGNSNHRLIATVGGLSFFS